MGRGNFNGTRLTVRGGRAKAEEIMDQQAIRTVEYDRPQAQGTSCGIGQAWAKVPDVPSAEQKVALKERIRALLKREKAVLVAIDFVEHETVRVVVATQQVEARVAGFAVRACGVVARGRDEGVHVFGFDVHIDDHDVHVPSLPREARV